MAKECGGGLSKSAASMFDLENGNFGAIDEEMVKDIRGIGDDAESAGRDSLIDVTISVGRSAFHGDEDGAGRNFARIVLYAGNQPI